MPHSGKKRHRVESHQLWIPKQRNVPTPGHRKYSDDFGEPPPQSHGINIATNVTSNQATGRFTEFVVSPPSNLSRDSMNNHPENGTSSCSPINVVSPEGTATPYIGRLCLESQRQDGGVCFKAPTAPTTGKQSGSKRPAISAELPRSKGNESPGRQTSENPRGSTAQVRPNIQPQKGLAKGSKHRTRKKRSTDPLHQIQPNTSRPVVPNNRGDIRPPHPHPRRTSCDSVPPQPTRTSSNGYPIPCGQPMLDIEWITRPIEGNPDRPLILQPASSPISPAQLAAEVKGIYSGLVVVEAKCINIDAVQSADPELHLGAEQWQALIALHRTLLYEHHDFLMATQHPSASEALKGLASKYTMPARMWKHGIHTFLEVLRHRRPESQDYMLAFIYLAYQMMALLYETVPTFVDTWIECLGDLARYRMAIEDDREIHAIWGRAAGHWYHMASDKHPGTGRLYHHLGILERMGLKKNFYYAKALTTVNPFPSARDSVATLCGPIVQDEQKFRAGYKSAEGRIMLFHALLFISVEDEKIENAGNEALFKLRGVSPGKIREWGVSLVVVNIAALLELGSVTNALWRWFGKAAYDEANSSSRLSSVAPHAFNLGNDNDDELLSETASSSLQHVHRFTYMSFSIIIRLGADHKSVLETLPSVHAMLVWIHALYKLQSRMPDGKNNDTVGTLMGPQQFDWVGLSNYLNTLAQYEPISARTVEWARQGNFLMPERAGEYKHLPEEFCIRGLVWTEFYFPSDWFKDCQPEDRQMDVESRAIETFNNDKIRAGRVQWLVLFLAFRTDYIKFDIHTKSFHVPVEGPPEFDQIPFQVDETKSEEDISPTQDCGASPPTSNRRSSTAFSTHSDSDGNVIVTKPTKSPKPPELYVSRASNNGVAQQNDKGFQRSLINFPHIANDDDDDMQSVHVGY